MGDRAGRGEGRWDRSPVSARAGRPTRADGERGRAADHHHGRRGRARGGRERPTSGVPQSGAVDGAEPDRRRAVAGARPAHQALGGQPPRRRSRRPTCSGRSSSTSRSTAAWRSRGPRPRPGHRRRRADRDRRAAAQPAAQRLAPGPDRGRPGDRRRARQRRRPPVPRRGLAARLGRRLHRPPVVADLQRRRHRRHRGRRHRSLAVRRLRSAAPVGASATGRRTSTRHGDRRSECRPALAGERLDRVVALSPMSAARRAAALVAAVARAARRRRRRRRARQRLAEGQRRRDRPRRRSGADGPRPRPVVDVRRRPRGRRRDRRRQAGRAWSSTPAPATPTARSSTGCWPRYPELAGGRASPIGRASCTASTRGTSGLLVVARTAAAYDALVDAARGAHRSTAALPGAGVGSPGGAARRDRRPDRARPARPAADGRRRRRQAGAHPLRGRSQRFDEPAELALLAAGWRPAAPTRSGSTSRRSGTRSSATRPTAARGAAPRAGAAVPPRRRARRSTIPRTGETDVDASHVAAPGRPAHG